MGAFNRLHITFGTVGGSIVELIAMFPERDAGTNRVADYVALNDPTLAPMRADEADLLGGWRCPRRGGVAHRETTDGDEVAPRLVGVEHGLAHVNFDELFIRIHALKLRPDRGVCRVHLCKPQLGIQG